MSTNRKIASQSDTLRVLNCVLKELRQQRALLSKILSINQAASNPDSKLSLSEKHSTDAVNYITREQLASATRKRLGIKPKAVKQQTKLFQ